MQDIRQTDPRRVRRWFTSAELDFFVWLDEAGEVAGYQFCFDKGPRERAIEWRAGTGFMQRRIDDGESRDAGHKATPVLTFPEPPDLHTALARFRAACAGVPRRFAGDFEAHLRVAITHARRHGRRAAAGRRRRTRGR